MATGQPQPAQLRSERALAWVARLRSDAISEADLNAFSLWLAESPDNKAAMDGALDMWDDMASLQYLPQPDPVAANTPSYRKLGASFALAASLLLGVFVYFQGEPADTSYYQTALGEQRSVELDDRSQLTLNTDTRVEVNYLSDERRIELLRGEAYFVVEPNPERPFHVDTGNIRVTAVGTAFNVYNSGDVSRVTVTEGVVKVTDTTTRPATVEILRADQSLRADAAGFTTAQVEADDSIAWQRGEIIAVELPLPELLAQLGRYDDTRILLGDTELATLTVSGVFDVDNTETVLQALALSHGLEATWLDADTVQLMIARQ